MAKLIALEGIDGSGKGTQCARIAAYLQAAGYRVTTMRFPNYDHHFFGREIGKYLNGELGSPDQIHPKLAAMLYAADRFESKPDILKAQANSDFLVFDRYVASNFAHQAAKFPESERTTFVAWLEHMEFSVYGLPKPDATLFLDVPPIEADRLVLKKEQRSYTTAKKDLYEQNQTYLGKVYTCYKSLSGREDWHRVTCCDQGVLLAPEVITDRAVAVLGALGYLALEK